MFEMVEEAGSPAVYLVGVGDAGCDAVRAVRDAGTLGVARYVLIDESIAVSCPGQLGEGFKFMSEGAVVATSAIPNGQRRADGGVQLVSDRVPELRGQVEEAMRSGEIILVVLDMRDPGNGAVARQVAEAARREAAIVLGVAVLPPDTADSHREAVAQVSALIEDGLATIAVPDNVLPGRSSREGGDEHGLDGIASVLLESHACVARGLVSPSLWGSVFQDVRVFLLGGGRCFMGWGTASGADRARRAVEEAIAHPLLGMPALLTAGSLLVCVRARSGQLREDEAREVMRTLQAVAGRGARIVVSAQYDDAMGDALRVSILARDQSQRSRALQ